VRKSRVEVRSDRIIASAQPQSDLEEMAGAESSCNQPRLQIIAKMGTKPNVSADLLAPRLFDNCSIGDFAAVRQAMNCTTRSDLTRMDKRILGVPRYFDGYSG